MTDRLTDNQDKLLQQMTAYIMSDPHLAGGILGMETLHPVDHDLLRQEGAVDVGNYREVNGRFEADLSVIMIRNGNPTYGKIHGVIEEFEPISRPTIEQVESSRPTFQILETERGDMLNPTGHARFIMDFVDGRPSGTGRSEHVLDEEKIVPYRETRPKSVVKDAEHIASSEGRKDLGSLIKGGPEAWSSPVRDRGPER